ncbi:hypothetical protein BDV96DRAFT_651647 [Lophiotrema nucula]|uniref:Uncharacterized protein n=1 Tax=Lophiotrema nucula TaxID=690887 RepID=A0A6A5YRL1_9PLEO|nr:hypothetical protein BDV96DRAFT_651647 [Lophiotrema nucula]
MPAVMVANVDDRQVERMEARGFRKSTFAKKIRPSGLVFEPELQYTLFAVIEQANDLVDGGDDDTEGDDGDPLPDGDEEDGIEGGEEGGRDAEDTLEAEFGESPHRRQARTPCVPRSSQIPNELDPSYNRKLPTFAKTLPSSECRYNQLFIYSKPFAMG